MENNKFRQADDAGREKVIKILKRFPAIKIIEPQQDDYAGVDILVTATTTTGIKTYAIECKDRYNYQSTDYGTDDGEGWLIENHKINVLNNYASSGYTPLYVMTYVDDVAIFWNTSTIDWNNCSKTALRQWNKTTVENSGKYEKRKIMLKNDMSVWQTTITK